MINLEKIVIIITNKDKKDKSIEDKMQERICDIDFYL